jgi:hypothetical protein
VNERFAARIVDAVADAAARWTDADYPPRVRATRALVERTGYTEPVVEYALDRLFGGLGRDPLRAVIADELGSPDALDAFVPRAGRPDVRYVGLARAAIVSSDTTIGVAIPALAFALCAGCTHVVVKDRDDRLVEAFARTLVEEEPSLARRLAVATWDGSDAAASDARLANADVILAYGRDETLAAIRARLAPGARFVPFGHRTSVGYVARATLDDLEGARAAARGAARDALLYDGDGCLSLHALFVERGAALDPGAFARVVAEACDATATEFPAAYTEPPPAVVAYRNAARFRASQGDGAVFASARGPHVIVLDPPRDEPPPLLPRTLALYAVDAPGEAAAFIARLRLSLEAVGTCGAARDDVAAFAIASGAARIAPLGALQDPPLGGDHGGVGRILPFVRAIYRA